MSEITVEEAMEILRQEGTIVTIEEAKIILDLLKGLAKLTLEKILKRDYIENL